MKYTKEEQKITATPVSESLLNAKAGQTESIEPFFSVSFQDWSISRNFHRNLLESN